MPRFQPGAHRYFGATPTPVSPTTAKILPFLRPASQAPRLPGRMPFRPMRPAKPKAFVIGKTERTDITKKLLKMPNYVPGATTKSLKKFAQQVVAHKKEYTKTEQVFAAATLDREKVIRDVSQQKKFIAGEAEALMATKDRRVTNPFAFTHRTEEVAGQTLRGLVKEQRAKETAPSIAEKRANLSRSREDLTGSTAAPTGGPSWTAPIPLDPAGSAADQGVRPETGAGWTAPFAPAPNAGLHSDTVHVNQGFQLAQLQGGGSADITILSDHLTDVEFHRWQSLTPQRLTHLPLSTAPLIRTFPVQPRVVVIDAQGIDRAADLTRGQFACPVIVFLGPDHQLADQAELPGNYLVQSAACSIEAIREILTKGTA